MQKNFISFCVFKKKVKKGLQEMVSFILSCLDRGLICSRMFQGGERLGESTECRGLFGVISLIFIFTVNGESSVLACRTELRGWIFFSFLWLRCRSGVVILLPSFLSASFQWSLFPHLPDHGWSSHFGLLGHSPHLLYFHLSLLILPQIVELELLSLHHL